jgi:hypothetical protein
VLSEHWILSSSLLHAGTTDRMLFVMLCDYTGCATVTSVSSQLIEPKSELRLILEPAPDESERSPEFQSELGAFERALREHGIEASQARFTQDAGGGWGTGEFILAAAARTAIVGLSKLIQSLGDAYLKIRDGRKLKLKFGTLTIEGHVDDIQQIFTAEQISKLLEPPKNAARKKQP